MRKTNSYIKVVSIFLLYMAINMIFLNGKVAHASAMTNIETGDKLLMDSFDQKAKSQRIEVKGVYYGHVSGKDTLNRIAKEITDIYIKEIGIDRDSISSANINLLINISEESVRVRDIETVESIAKRIYEDRDNNNLDIELKAIEEVNEPIERETEYVKTDDLYMGQSKSIEGSNGVKNVVKIVKYSLKEKTEEIVLEEVVQASTANIVYEGERNPYVDGIAFLKKPTNSLIITSYFGSRWNSFHKGIDIAGNVGDPVDAAINGEVVYAQFNDGGYGNLIIVEHDNNMKSYYAHLSKINVQVGDNVQKGDKIGEVGNTGNSTGPHLHFELRVNDEPVDPLKYIIK